MEKYLDKNSVLRLLQGIKTQIDKSKTSVLETKGVANGIASLDENGNVPLSQLGNVDTDIHEIALELPTQLTEKQSKHIFLVPRGVDEKTNKNIYKEYIFTGSDITNVKDTDWEQLGEFTTSVDLKDYSKKSETISDIRFTDMDVDGSWTSNTILNNLLFEFADGKRKIISIPLASGPYYGTAHQSPGGPGFMSGEDKAKLDKIDLNALTTSITAANTAADNTNKAIKAADTATTGAERVNATLTEENVFEVIDRTGVKKTLDMSGLVSAQSDVARIQESMGAYSDRPNITLVAKETNKAISADGVKVTKAGWAIAEFTAEKGNVYLFKPNVIDESVCIFAEYIQSVETRGIDYTYTYNPDGTTATATATYLGVTHTYTFTYAEDKSFVITDETGAAVNALPMVYETKVGAYSPLVSLNADAELPKDGYCRYMSHFKGNSAIKVVVSYKVGVADLTMKVTRDGVLASISTQLGNLSQKEDETRKKIDELHADYVDVLYSEDTSIQVDYKKITVKGKKKTRLYPKTQLHLGGVIYGKSVPLRWLDVSHLTSAIKLGTIEGSFQQGLFINCVFLTSLNLNNLDFSKVTNLCTFFRGCKSLQNVDINACDVSHVKNMNQLFENCSRLKDIDVSAWDVSNVVSFVSTFAACSSLQSIDLSGWDVSKATSLNNMFSGCTSLHSIDLSSWDVSNVKNIQDLFWGCKNLESIDLSGWVLKSCTVMDNIGDYAPIKTIKLGTGFFNCPATKTILKYSAWTDASVKESLVVNSYDRKANGLPDFTLTLHANTKKVLSEDDIAAITAKGYIIA